MATRNARANIILGQKWNEFDLVTRRLMKVPSQYTPGLLYDVRMRDGVAVSGSCPDWLTRQPAGGCKHMIAAYKYYHLRF